VPPRDERALAARLDRVLDGREPADGEVAALAAVLERAAAPARFEVSEAEIESAFADARRRKTSHRPERRLRLRPVFGLTVVAAAAAAILAIVLTRAPGIDVEGRALAALGGPTNILRVVERIEPVRPGTFPASTRVGWLDPAGGRARWRQWVQERVIAETLVERGRVSRYLLAENAVIVGTSCRAFASGCAELVDPIDVYRRALQVGSGRTVSATVEGRKVYVLTLPVQNLPDALRISQRVTIDRRTYLPLRIDWFEERPGTEPRSFSVIRIRKVLVLPGQAGSRVFELDAPSNVRVVQRVAPGRNLRKLGERRLSLREVRAIRPALQWLGPEYFGQPVTGIVEVRWNAGTTYRIRYGVNLTIWNYGALVPPEIASTRYVPAKTIPISTGVVRFYTALDGRLVAELEGALRSVALIGPEFGKESFIEAAERLQPLR
jgi:hypothetical protein